jgi:hypothetical protein
MLRSHYAFPDHQKALGTCDSKDGAKRLPPTSRAAIRPPAETARCGRGGEAVMQRNKLLTNV